MGYGWVISTHDMSTLEALFSLPSSILILLGSGLKSLISVNWAIYLSLERLEAALKVGELGCFFVLLAYWVVCMEEGLRRSSPLMFGVDFAASWSGFLSYLC